MGGNKMATTPTSARGARRTNARAASAEVDIDLDAVRAHNIAHNGSTFRLGGRTYHLAPAQALPVDVLDALNTGAASAVIEAVSLALPEDERPSFLAAKPDLGQIEALSNKWLAKSGLSLGGSEASPESYATTAGQ
jgi:hypothetical protein